MIMDSHKYIFGFKCEVYYEGGDPYSLSMMNYAKKKIFTGCLLHANSMCFSTSGLVFYLWIVYLFVGFEILFQI